MSAPKTIALGEKSLQERYAHSRAADYGLSFVGFRDILCEITSKYCSHTSEAEALLGSLRLEELALARGCAAGNERAWTEFLNRYRARLHDAARSITRQETSARELADGLYADLFGTEVRDGIRRCKLEHYSGRGSLEGWLRTVLAQEWVNRFRKTRRETSLEQQQEAGAQFVSPTAVPQTMAATNVVLARATDTVLAGLPSEERYILAAYHLDGRKLAEVARVLGMHESTISRKIEKIAAKVRAAILKHLQKEGMSRRQAEEALETDVRDLNIDVRAPLRSEEKLSSTHVQGEALRAFSQGEEPK